MSNEPDLRLTDISYLEAKAAAGLSFELDHEFSEAAAALPEGDRRRRLLELLADALRRDIHFIDRHREGYSQALFQCLWNSCWWNGHCSTVPGGRPEQDHEEGRTPREQDRETGLRELLQQWHAAKQRSPDRPALWVRSLLPPEYPLGTGQTHVFVGHECPVLRVTFADSHSAASLSGDGTIRFWDLDSGKEQEGRRVVVAELASAWKSNRYSGRYPVVALAADARFGALATSPTCIKVYDLQHKAELRTLDLTVSGDHGGARELIFSPDIADFTSMAFSGDGRFLFSGDAVGNLRRWDVQSAEQILCMSAGRPITSLAASADGSLLFAGLEAPPGQSILSILVVTPGRQDRVGLLGPEKNARVLDATPDGRHFVSGSDDGTICLWRTNSQLEFKGPGLGVNRPELGFQGIELPRSNTEFPSPWLTMLDHRYGGNDRQGQAKTSYPVSCLSISRDGARVAFARSAGDDNAIWVKDTSAEAEAVPLRGHVKAVTDVAFAPDATRLISASADTTLRLWSVSSLPPSRRESERIPAVTCVAFSADGTRFAVGTSSKRVYVFDANTGDELASLHRDDWKVGSVQFLRDNRLVLSDVGTNQCVARLWVWEAGVLSPFVTLDGHHSPVATLVLSADGSRIATTCGSRPPVSGYSGHDTSVRVWDARSGKCLHRLVHVEWSEGLDMYALDLSEKLLAAATLRSIDVWDVESGKQVCSLNRQWGVPARVALSQDGRKVAAAGTEATELWEIDSGKQISSIPYLTDPKVITDGAEACPYVVTLDSFGAVVRTGPALTPIGWYAISRAAEYNLPLASQDGLQWACVSPAGHHEVFRIEAAEFRTGG